MGILLSDEERGKATIKGTKRWKDNPVASSEPYEMVDFITDEVAKAQLKKMVEWLGDDIRIELDDQVTDGVTIYLSKKDWQSLLKEIE